MAYRMILAVILGWTFFLWGCSFIVGDFYSVDDAGHQDITLDEVSQLDSSLVERFDGTDKLLDLDLSREENADAIDQPEGFDGVFFDDGVETGDDISGGEDASQADTVEDVFYDDGMGMRENIIAREDGSGIDVNLPCQRGTIFLESSNQSATNSGTRTIAFDHLSSGNNRLLLVAVAHRGGAESPLIVSVEFNHRSLNFLTDSVDLDPTVVFYYLVNPDVGKYSIEVVFSAETDRAAVGAISLSGVDQGTWQDSDFARLGGETDNFSVDSITTTINAWVVDAVATDLCSGEPFPSRQKTWEICSSEPCVLGSVLGPIETPGQVTMGWTLSIIEKFRIIAVPIRAACQ